MERVWESLELCQEAVFRAECAFYSFCVFVFFSFVFIK
jgi:hypothetical protein